MTHQRSRTTDSNHQQHYFDLIHVTSMATGLYSSVRVQSKLWPVPQVARQASLSHQKVANQPPIPIGALIEIV